MSNKIKYNRFMQLGCMICKYTKNNGIQYLCKYHKIKGFQLNWHFIHAKNDLDEV